MATRKVYKIEIGVAGKRMGTGRDLGKLMFDDSTLVTVSFNGPLVWRPATGTFLAKLYSQQSTRSGMFGVTCRMRVTLSINCERACWGSPDLLRSLCDSGYRRRTSLTKDKLSTVTDLPGTVRRWGAGMAYCDVSEALGILSRPENKRALCAALDP